MSKDQAAWVMRTLEHDTVMFLDGKAAANAVRHFHIYFRSPLMRSHSIARPLLPTTSRLALRARTRYLQSAQHLRTSGQHEGVLKNRPAYVIPRVDACHQTYDQGYEGFQGGGCTYY